MFILEEIPWIFDAQEYETIKDFNTKISKAFRQITLEGFSWQPHNVVVSSPVIDVIFRAWITPNSLAENETLLEDEDFFENEKNKSNGLFLADLKARLHANNNKDFTALELLYKLDKQMKSKELGDHIYFEGLSDEGLENGIPQFEVMNGS